MKLELTITGTDYESVSVRRTELSQFCKLMGITLIWPDRLHDKEYYCSFSEAYEDYLRVNALSCFCHLKQIATTMIE